MSEVFKVGKTYKSNCGEEVLIVGYANEGTSYETVYCKDGLHRYSRRDFGRSTGSAFDHSHPNCLIPEMSEKDLQLEEEIMRIEDMIGQRQASIDAGRIRDMKVLGILNSETAASLDRILHLRRMQDNPPVNPNLMMDDEVVQEILKRCSKAWGDLREETRRAFESTKRSPG